ncbi:hypothetical protein ACFLZB_02285 [Nanoarchaeota archaeon]
MDFRDVLVTAIAALLTSCSSYEIPKQEVARLQILVYQNQIKEINLEEFFQDHQIPKLQDHFFYVLYHLEQQSGNYMVDKQNLINFFEKNNLNSSLPLDELEKIVREHDFTKIYTGGFSEEVPGSEGKLSLCASENLCFYGQTKKPNHRTLNLVWGSLDMEINFPYNLVVNIKPEVRALEIYDLGSNIIFYCECQIDGERKKSRVFYHARDSTSSEREGWNDNAIIGRE